MSVICAMDQMVTLLQQKLNHKSNLEVIVLYSFKQRGNTSLFQSLKAQTPSHSEGLFLFVYLFLQNKRRQKPNCPSDVKLTLLTYQYQILSSSI